MTERQPRTIYVGATQNGNKSVGGWLPFVVDLSPIYHDMRVHGTLYTDYGWATFEQKEDAIKVAVDKAMKWHADVEDEIVEVKGCHRCWDRNSDTNACCGK